MHLLLDPIMFSGDTNLVFNHKDMKHLFTGVNNELVNIKDWFTANTHFFSISQVKKKISLFAHQNLQSITVKYKEKNVSNSMEFH